MATEGSVLHTFLLEGSAQSSSLPVSGVALLSGILAPSLSLTAFPFMCSDPNMSQIQTSLISKSCGHKPTVKQQASKNFQGTHRDKAPAAACPYEIQVCRSCNTGALLSATNYFISLAASFLEWPHAVCHKAGEIYSQPQHSLTLGYMDGQDLIINTLDMQYK